MDVLKIALPPFVSVIGMDGNAVGFVSNGGWTLFRNGSQNMLPSERVVGGAVQLPPPLTVMLPGFLMYVKGETTWPLPEISPAAAELEDRSIPPGTFTTGEPPRYRLVPVA
jgi:hypothetical protein